MWYTQTREELLWRAESVLSWVGNNAIEVRIGGTYPLSRRHRPTVTSKAARQPASSSLSRR